MDIRLKIIFLYILLSAAPSVTLASSHQNELEEDDHDQEIIGVISDENIISYPSLFFEKFQPLTALDMVEQVPGFQLENNNSTRGIGNALGNLLINDRRPAAKQDQPSEILSRIPASSVQRVELIRGQVREIDLRGQSNLVNLVLKEDEDVTIQWEAFIRRTFGYGKVSPAASVSISDTWSGIEYNIGLSARRAYVGRDGTEEIRDGGGILTEDRIVGRDNRNTHYKTTLNVSKWLGESFFRFNSNISISDHLHTSFSNRYPVDPLNRPEYQFIRRDGFNPQFEVGFDIERNMSEDLFGKFIFLFIRNFWDDLEVQTITDSRNNQTLIRTADTFNVNTEGITRLELDWSGIEDHAIQLNLEGAYNLLDGKFIQIDEDGLGPELVDVPGANSKVEEIRGDFVLQDTWSTGLLEFEYGVGAEVSTITQTGDVNQERSFFFIKPHAMMTYSPEPGKQTRLRLAREVSQLNLRDFISGIVFEDDDLALGNPDIRPDTTWIGELSHERRIGGNSSIKLTLFHHWIHDVLDLLPLSSDFEAPGNIGNGRRWGVRMESTLPLDWSGLSGARLKFIGRWQDSSVTDPVTGNKRVLSALGRNARPLILDLENEYAYTVDFRQDFEDARVSWGWTMTERAELQRFRVNELEIFDDGTFINAFIETTRWFGVKINLFAENVLDLGDTRYREIYSGERGLSPLSSTLFRDQTRGPRIFLTFSGTF